MKDKRLLIGISTTDPQDAIDIAKEMRDVMIIKRHDDAMMEWTRQAIGFTEAQMKDPKLLDSYLEDKWSYIRNERFVSPKDGISVQGVKYHTTPRHILNKIQYAGREIHSQFWVNLLYTQWQNLPAEKGWLVTDVNYPNEADGIIENGGALWRIERSTYIRKTDFIAKYPHIHRRFVVNGPLTQVIDQLHKCVEDVERTEA